MMRTIKVTTGFGYFVDPAGHIISPALLPVGDHPMLDDYIYVEVADKESLDAVELYQDPVALERAKNERKVFAKIRRTAIDALVAAGQLPGDYE